jgi:hypothetical protein
MADFEEFRCPFCKQDDFDLWGLQYHLQNYCDVFGRVNSDNSLPIEAGDVEVRLK